jgi:hypothetical protein
LTGGYCDWSVWPGQTVVHPRHHQVQERLGATLVTLRLTPVASSRSSPTFTIQNPNPLDQKGSVGS